MKSKRSPVINQPGFIGMSAGKGFVEKNHAHLKLMLVKPISRNLRSSSIPCLFLEGLPKPCGTKSVAIIYSNCLWREAYWMVIIHWLSSVLGRTQYTSFEISSSSLSEKWTTVSPDKKVRCAFSPCQKLTKKTLFFPWTICHRTQIISSWQTGRGNRERLGFLREPWGTSQNHRKP